MWKKSIDCDPNYLTQAETCKKIAALYYKRGDLKNYALYMSKMSEAKDSLYTRKKKYNMSELQSNINSSLSMKDLLGHHNICIYGHTYYYIIMYSGILVNATQNKKEADCGTQ